MDFVSIQTLRELSGYRDRRSIQRWIARLGLTLHKIGKNWCVKKEELDRALEQTYPHVPQVAISQPPSTPHERTFLSDLQNFLSEV